MKDIMNKIDFLFQKLQKDSNRYEWLRNRLEVKQIRNSDGSYHYALHTIQGRLFVDVPCSPRADDEDKLRMLETVIDVQLQKEKQDE